MNAAVTLRRRYAAAPPFFFHDAYAVIYTLLIFVTMHARLR